MTKRFLITICDGLHTFSRVELEELEAFADVTVLRIGVSCPVFAPDLASDGHHSGYFHIATPWIAEIPAELMRNLNDSDKPEYTLNRILAFIQSQHKPPSIALFRSGWNAPSLFSDTRTLIETLKRWDETKRRAQEREAKHLATLAMKDSKN